MANGKKKRELKWENMGIGAKVGLVIAGVIAGAGLLFLFGFVVMSLWNWLMPKIFGLPLLGYWEAWGVLILSCVLFGRLGGGSRSSERGRKRKLRERIQQMGKECGEEKENKQSE